MYSFLSKKQKKSFFILSVGSDSVSLAVAVRESNNKKSIPRVVFAQRKMYTGDTRILKKIVEDLCKQCVLNKVPQPEYLVCVVESALVGLENRVIKYQAYHPFDFTEDFLQTFIDAELTTIQDSLDRTKKTTGAESIVVSEYIGGVRLNGISVETPFGAKAQMFDCMLHVLYGDARLFEAITDGVTRAYHGLKLFWYHETFADALALRDLFSQTPTFWLCDIHNNQTTLALVEDDVFVTQLMIPGGMNELFELYATSARGQSINHKEQFRLYGLGTLDSAVSVRLQKMVDESSVELAQVLQQIIHSYPKSFHIPFFMHQTLVNATYVKKVAQILSQTSEQHFSVPYLYSGLAWKDYVFCDTKYTALAQRLFPYVLIAERHNRK